ncbi:hypothetical protein N9R47_04510 [Flavobacteriaceae bacterium]|nr:hypothetical protein [Flavobacteriaceae bacterium]
MAFHKLIDKSGFRFSRVSKLESNEYVILGNSRGVNSVNERFCVNDLGLRVINLSYNGLTPVLIDNIISDLNNMETFKKTTFLIEVSAFLGWEEVKTTEGCKSRLVLKYNEVVPDILLPFRHNFASVDSVYKKLYPLNSFFHLLNYNNEGFLRGMYYLNKTDNNWVNRKEIDQSLIEYYSNMNCIQFSFDKDNLDQFVNTMSNKNINFKFFMAPWHPSYKHKFVNYDMVLNIIESQYNINVIRLDNLTLDDSAFADGMHTNIKGAKYLSKVLLEHIN